MSDEFIKAIEPVRNQYVEGYAAWLNEQIRQHSQGSGERLYEIQGQTNFARKLCRVDFAVTGGDNARTLEYSPKEMLGFPPMQGPVDGVIVQLHPFRWDRAVVEIPGAIWNKDKVTEWFNHWFGMVRDTPAASPRSKPGFHIHACAWPEPGMLLIDFGSAPAKALADLIGVARGIGAEQMVIRDAQVASPDAGQPVPGHPIAGQAV